MSTDAWLDTYLTDDFLPEAPDTSKSASTAWNQAVTDVAAADPRLILGTVLDVLTARGVPVAIERLDRALEDIGRLLRDLGVENVVDAWAVR